MKLEELVALYVGDSSLDPISVKRFLQFSPLYHAWGLTHQIEPTSLAQLAATDLVAFYLRMYLIGRYKTLRVCLRETQAFARQDDQSAPEFLVFSLEHTGWTLLQLEWYELLSPLAVAREQILAIVPGGEYPTHPKLIRLLNEAYF